MKAKHHDPAPCRGVRDPKTCKVQSGGTLRWLQDGEPMFWSDRPVKFETHIRMVLGEYRVKRGGKPVHTTLTDIKWKQLGSETWWRIPAWPDGSAMPDIPDQDV